MELWDISAPTRRLNGGHRNIAYRTLGLTPNLVFKQTRRSEASLRWLVPVHNAARSAGFVVPQLIEGIRGNIMEAGWTCEPYFDAKPFAPHDLPLIKSRITSLHRLTRNFAQRPGFVSAADLSLTNAGGDIDLAKMPSKLACRCMKAWEDLKGADQAAIHGDLTPSNLLWQDDGKPVLLDWDEARVDASLFDHIQLTERDKRDAGALRASLAWEICCSWRIEPAHARKLAKVFLNG